MCSKCRKLLNGISKDKNEILIILIIIIKQHMRECTYTDYPNEGIIIKKPTLKFNNIQWMHRHLYAIYCDRMSFSKK